MSTQEFLIPARPDLAAAREGWLRALARERRLAELTVEAYERDTRQFLHFLTGHCGGAPGLKLSLIHISEPRDPKTSRMPSSA